jgi:hypothetical protein
MEIKQENGRTTHHFSIKDKEDVNAMVLITYDVDLQDFLKINFLANEVLFINHKLEKVQTAIRDLKPIIEFGDEPDYNETREHIKAEGYDLTPKDEIRKLYWWSVRYESFLKERLQELNKPEQPEPEPLDLSDTTAVEKIIYLNELGVIDFLRTKTKAGISNGGLASVLSGITGIKADTIRPSLNRLVKNDTDDKNHPYFTTKTVDKIKLFLSQLGF